MEYVAYGILILFFLAILSRIIIKNRAKKLVFEKILPSILVEEFPDREIGFIGVYIFINQREIFDDISVSHGLGIYGAKAALSRLNIIQGLSNSTEVLSSLENITGEELLNKIKALIIKVEKRHF